MESKFFEISMDSFQNEEKKSIGHQNGIFPQEFISCVKINDGDKGSLKSKLHQNCRPESCPYSSIYFNNYADLFLFSVASNAYWLDKFGIFYSKSTFSIIQVYVRSLYSEFRRKFDIKPLPCQFEIDCAGETAFYQTRTLTMPLNNHIIIEGANFKRMHSDVTGRVYNCLELCCHSIEFFKQAQIKNVL